MDHAIFGARRCRRTHGENDAVVDSAARSASQNSEGAYQLKNALVHHRFGPFESGCHRAVTCPA